MLTRQQMFGPVGHRGQTRQRLRLGADAEGRLTAIDHEGLAATSSFDDFIEPAANASQGIYAAGALASRHKAVRLDIGTPGPMRAPGEASGSAALECAMDEMAEALGLDPLEFRLRNYAETEPGTGPPVLVEGAARLLCAGRRAVRLGRPSAARRGSCGTSTGLLVGWGMGTAFFPSPMFAAEARATLRPDGTALVETSAVDMGQGAWTALAQIAADSLGLPLEQVEFRAGHSAPARRRRRRRLGPHRDRRRRAARRRVRRDPAPGRDRRGRSRLAAPRRGQRHASWRDDGRLIVEADDEAQRRLRRHPRPRGRRETCRRRAAPRARPRSARSTR